MAAVITGVEVGTAFGIAAATAPLDGLVLADLDRVDKDYAVDDGDGTVKARRLIVLRYEPPANTPNLDYYNAQGKVLNIKRMAAPARVYHPKVLQVIESHENRSGVYQIVITVITAVSDTDLAALLSGDT